MRTLSAAVLLALPAVCQPADDPDQEIAAVAKELALPPLRPGDDFALDKQKLPAAAMKAYTADVSVDEIQKAAVKYRLRNTVLKAFATVRETWTFSAPATPPPAPKGTAKKGPRPAPVVGFLATVRSPVTEGAKTLVRDYQVLPAVGIAKLEQALRDLEAVVSLRSSEPRRWQAHYDYAVAEVTARIAYLHEYDLALGTVLTDSLPDLDKAKGNDGWRLVPAAKMHSKKDVQKLAEQAREQFEKLAAAHKDTPWAALAKRALDRQPGLKWEPTGGK